MNRKDTPGAGLGQLLGPRADAEPEVDLADDEPTRIECPKCHSPLERCPACRGSTFESLEPITGGQNNAKYGEYRWVQCGYCQGAGFCAVSRAEAWRAAQLSKKK